MLQEHTVDRWANPTSAHNNKVNMLHYEGAKRDRLRNPLGFPKIDGARISGGSA
jgi:hypothetical protein